VKLAPDIHALILTNIFGAMTVCAWDSLRDKPRDELMARLL
jgi:hypothetical protein